MKYMVVGIAGAVGALLRYALSLYVHIPWLFGFPVATWVVNMSGSFLLAWLTARIFERPDIHPYFAPAVGTGLVGSFTTFSTFSMEVVTLWQNQAYLSMGIYMTMSAWGGFYMAWLGFYVGKKEMAVS
ncbi:CrcB family protein [Ectobacillus antri]|jgi:CrcB protein|uniref:Fluoride-specific ion channel FluC n=1 Tax=Ectobacillus antri TaxID=2486280 RepID=A0ABT6H3Q0_9BACI|nr:CrcB family protein [Ectobacillus antri]MDG4655670.1 CrcB family protein [Ectobacillus antri]MDG5753428.1 CrcB family protein [Ectobacillus antri]